MNRRWSVLAMLVILLGILSISLAWWFSTTKPADMPHDSGETRPAMPATTAAPAPKQIQPPAGTVKMHVLEGIHGFADAEKINPDVHPFITVFTSMFDEETREAMFANPETKRAFELVISPEYIEFMQTKPSIREQDEFWAKHGFFSDPDRFMKAFREQFPTGEPEDFEPEMRRKYAELYKGFTEENQIEIVLTQTPKFLSNPRTRAWMKGYFNRDGNFTAWTSSIRQEILDANSQKGTAEQAPRPTDSSAPDELDMFLDLFEQDDVTEEKDLQRDVGTPAVFEESNTADIPDGSQERPEVVTLDALEPPELPTDKSVETQLRAHFDSERFSPKRLNTALQTLNRYGPEEGLRRLNAADPEIAEYVKRTLRKQQERE